MVDFLFISKCDDISTQNICGILKASFELIGRTSNITSDVKETDIINSKYIILYGTEYSDELKEFILKHKKRIGFTIDDFIFSGEEIEGISVEFKKNIIKTLQEVDYCFCFNNKLKQEMDKYNRNSFLLPLPILWDGLYKNFNISLPVLYNNTSIRIGILSEKLYQSSLYDGISDIIESAEDNLVEIIYFSDKDIEIEVPPNVKLERHNCITTFKEYYTKLFSLKLDILFFSYKDMDLLQYKTNIKYRESSYMKVPLVVIDISEKVCPEIINEQNGYSVKNREDAKKALRDLINNKELRINLGNNANLYYHKKEPIPTANLIYNSFITNIESFKFKDHTLHILAIAEGAIPPTEIMLINPLIYLRDQGLITFDLLYASQAIRSDIKIDYNRYNVIIILRLCSIEAYNKFINMPKQQYKHLKFVYMLDDDFPSLSCNLPVGVHYKKINTALEQFVKNSDSVIVPSKNLFKKYSSLNQKIFLTTAYHNIDEINKLKQSIDNKGVIVIGYAASIHHYENFKILINPLKQILQKFSYVRFECYFGEGKVKGLEGLNVISYPLISGLNNFYKHILSRGWDIGVAPLQNNEFNRCKSDNKYREYASFEIAGIYSDIECYNMIRNKETGILCKSEADWYYAMEKLILNIEKRKRIIKNAYEDVKKIYNIHTITDNYMKVFRGEL
jgi:glycosyltransferase involved in cell wall biosynthesis